MTTCCILQEGVAIAVSGLPGQVKHGLIDETCLFACAASAYFRLACPQEGAAIAGSGLPDHCTWRWMAPKRQRGGVPQGSTPFQPWGWPGVLKDSARSVFVRNLPFESTYEDLSTFFSQAGEVSWQVVGYSMVCCVI
jgi:hypothetical protein